MFNMYTICVDVTHVDNRIAQDTILFDNLNLFCLPERKHENSDMNAGFSHVIFSFP